MVYLLNYFGHQTMEAHDGREGIDLARRELPDLILMDLHMPGIDGYEAARQIGSDPNLRKIPIVAVTALAMVGDREKVLAAGFNGYIAKPINPETFVSELEAFMGSAPPSPPRPSAPPATPDAPTPPRVGSPRATILYVDNTLVNLHLVRNTLEPFGYKVITTKSVPEAVEEARKTPVDLILSDMHMPHLDGYEFLKILKADARLASIPFAFLSSTVRANEDRASAVGLGAVKFISRPIEPKALLAEIEDCLSRGRAV